MDFESLIGGMLKRKIELGDRLIERLPGGFGPRAKELRDACLSAVAKVSRDLTGVEGGEKRSEGPRKVDID